VSVSNVSPKNNKVPPTASLLSNTQIHHERKGPTKKSRRQGITSAGCQSLVAPTPYLSRCNVIMNIIGILILIIAALAGFFFILSKRSRKGGMIALLCVISFCIWQWHQEQRWAQQFYMIPDGASEQYVITAMGKPSIISYGDKSPLGYSLTEQNKNIKKEYWYVSFALPEQFDFGFDARGNLIDRYHYVSP